MVPGTGRWSSTTRRARSSSTSAAESSVASTRARSRWSTRSRATGFAPVVRGYQQKLQLGPKRTQYSGEGGVRFRLIGGLYRVRIDAIGIDVSVVGRGTVLLDGSGFADQSGRFSVNGGPVQSMPHVQSRFTLGLPLPATLPSK